MRNSQVGDLLVSSTIVDGSVLNQSVCLLVHEDEENAIALLLNRPMQAVQVGSGDASPQKTNRIESKSSNRIPAAANSDKAGKQGKPMITVVGPADDPEAGQILNGKSLHFGGPLSGPVVAIHGAAELGEAEAGEGIFVAAQRDHLEALMQTDQVSPYRLIIGHLGWTQEQLNLEIAQGVWHRIPATSDILWTDDGLLWPALIRRATSSSMSRWLGVSHVADAHLLN